VVELLRAAAHDRNSTILVVAHDARIIPHVDRVFHLEDGVLAESSQAPEFQGEVEQAPLGMGSER
jgi:ABC-type lipoprotein export system ATPase subunit